MIIYGMCDMFRSVWLAGDWIPQPTTAEEIFSWGEGGVCRVLPSTFPFPHVLRLLCICVLFVPCGFPPHLARPNITVPFCPLSNYKFFKKNIFPHFACSCSTFSHFFFCPIYMFAKGTGCYPHGSMIEDKPWTGLSHVFLLVACVV